jgi:hypothetical protein
MQTVIVYSQLLYLSLKQAELLFNETSFRCSLLISGGNKIS